MAEYKCPLDFRSVSAVRCALLFDSPLARNTMAANLTNVELQTAFIGLSIVGTLFSALSALFGDYLTRI